MLPICCGLELQNYILPENLSWQMMRKSEEKSLLFDWCAVISLPGLVVKRRLELIIAALIIVDEACATDGGVFAAVSPLVQREDHRHGWINLGGTSSVPITWLCYITIAFEAENTPGLYYQCLWRGLLFPPRWYDLLLHHKSDGSKHTITKHRVSVSSTKGLEVAVAFKCLVWHTQTHMDEVYIQPESTFPTNKLYEFCLYLVQLSKTSFSLCPPPHPTLSLPIYSMCRYN